MFLFICCFIVFLLSVVLCTVFGWSTAAALLTGYICFFMLAVKRGHSPEALLKEFCRQIAEVRELLSVLLLLGALTASWRESGTLALLVCCGFRIITPSLFLAVTFLATSLIAYMIGSVFGVAGIMGAVFMTIGAAGNVNPLLTAGALFSGIYFGDRTSPVSSTFLTLQSITKKPSGQMVKMLLKDCLLPFFLCTVLYVLLSAANPLQGIDDNTIESLQSAFRLSAILLLPAVIMFLFPALHLNNLTAMGLSVGISCLLAIGVQGCILADCLHTCLFGYTGETPAIDAMLGGGGVTGMVEVCCIVCLSVNLLPVMEFCGLEDFLLPAIQKAEKQAGRTTVTVLLVLFANLIFCNQTVPLYLTSRCMKSFYEEGDSDRMLVDISDANILGGAVPWSISCKVPLAMFGTNLSCLLFAFYLWIQPLVCCFKRNSGKWRR